MASERNLLEDTENRVKYFICVFRQERLSLILMHACRYENRICNEIQISRTHTLFIQDTYFASFSHAKLQADRGGVAR